MCLMTSSRIYGNSTVEGSRTLGGMGGKTASITRAHHLDPGIRCKVYEFLWADTFEFLEASQSWRMVHTSGKHPKMRSKTTLAYDQTILW